MSKGLEALKRIRQETCPATYMQDFDKNECCDIIEKELKALEIIKKSVVEMSNTKVLMGDYYQVVLALDQKEYDLLKEVLL